METCLFCLEETNLTDNPVLFINFSKYPDVCSCHINSHMDCWMIYYLKKGYFECPICHTKADQRPNLTEQNITVRTENVVVQITAPTPRNQVRDHSSEQAMRRTTFCFVCGCIFCWGLFFLCLFVPVFVFLKR
jgi:hypothetical protein